jgi:site-specific DNA-methyltransferase (adenine-specific)
LVSVFRAVRRVLKPDGTLWLVLGDTYAGGGRSGSGGNRGVKQESNRGSTGLRPLHLPGIAKKQLLGIPWRVAFGLQDDGWILRSAIVWAKPNPMCEPVKDRPTSAYENVFVLSQGTRDELDYEHLFLLSQKPKYLYDADAIREPPTGRLDRITFGQTPDRRDNSRSYPLIGANCRNVWVIPPQPNKNGHFAVMPVELASRCIKAGSRVGDTVLDPFGGVGSVGIACQNLERSSILIELNPQYVALGEERLRQNRSDRRQRAG